MGIERPQSQREHLPLLGLCPHPPRLLLRRLSSPPQLHAHPVQLALQPLHLCRMLSTQRLYLLGALTTQTLCRLELITNA